MSKNFNFSSISRKFNCQRLFLSPFPNQIDSKAIWQFFRFINLSSHQAIGLMSRVFTNGPGDWGGIIPKTQKKNKINKIKNKIEKKKRYLMPPCLALSTI